MAHPKLIDQPGPIEITAAFRADELAPRETVKDSIKRIEHIDVQMNAVAVRNYKHTVATAAHDSNEIVIG